MGKGREAEVGEKPHDFIREQAPSLPDSGVRLSHARAFLGRILACATYASSQRCTACAERISSDAASMPARYACAPPFPGPKRFLVFFTERICPAINRRLAEYCAKVAGLLVDTPRAASSTGLQWQCQQVPSDIAPDASQAWRRLQGEQDLRKLQPPV